MTLWLQITSGQGPAECCWVVARLAEVLQQAAVEAGLELCLLETTGGDQPGTFRSALFSLEGQGAALFVEPWRGTVQWIGKSPFRPHHKRKNWFVGVQVFAPPEQPSWSAEELQIEAMRSSGPGGQHVNKTSSAIRITHLPSGLSAIAREERSQHRNRKLALARLAELFEQRRADAEGGARQQRWAQHSGLERGNAVRMFEGPQFRPARGGNPPRSKATESEPHG
jgi:peptide chain release factor